MRTCLIVAMLTAGAMLPAAALAQRVSYDFDRAADFGKFKTYSMQTGAISDNPLLDNRIIANIETQLAAKGLEKTTDTPDLNVAARMSYEKENVVTGYNSGWGYWPYGWGYGYWPYYGKWNYDPWGTHVVVEEILVGTLTIDLVDAETNTLIWRGTAVRDMNELRDPDKIDRRVRHSIEKVFRKYPPDLDDD